MRRVGVGVNIPTLLVEPDEEEDGAEGAAGGGVEARPPKPKGPPPKILNPKPTKPLFQDD